MENLSNFIIEGHSDLGEFEEEKRELDQMPDDEGYCVLQCGGSLGEFDKDNYYRVGNVFGKIIAQDLTKEEAAEKAKRLRKMLSPGERKYYGLTYRAVPMKQLKKIETR